MPLSAKRQAERRAAKKRLEDPKKFPRKHCRNCNKLFPMTRPNRGFCSTKCVREFHQNGGNAFGPLKIRLEKLVREIAGASSLHWVAQYKVLCEANADMWARIHALESALWARIHALESALSQSPSQPSPSASAIRARSAHP